jgi:hypothetical protein
LILLREFRNLEWQMMTSTKSLLELTDRQQVGDGQTRKIGKLKFQVHVVFDVCKAVPSGYRISRPQEVVTLTIASLQMIEQGGCCYEEVEVEFGRLECLFYTVL